MFNMWRTRRCLYSVQKDILSLAFHATCVCKHRLLSQTHLLATAKKTPYLNATGKSNKPHMKPTLTELEFTGPNSSFEFDDASCSIKRVWAYVETHKLGPPLVPVVVAVRRTMEYIGKATLRKKLDFVHLVCH